MALEHAQQALRRKFIYFGIVVLLLFALISNRNLLDRQAHTHDLKEIDLGEVDLQGSAARFMLVSFRGPLICGLWWEAIERQTKHEWAELQILIRSIAKLQPYFRRPWEFQGWNLAYNVSVEFDRVQDKYFFIAEGVQWLVEGERHTRSRVYNEQTGTKQEVGEPGLRGYIGEVIQFKMNHADEHRTYKCLFQLSCIPREKRDPTQLRLNPQMLEDFKRAYPILVERIRKLRHVAEGSERVLNEEILAFLEQYRDIPSAYAPRRTPGVWLEGTQVVHSCFPVWPETLEPANKEDERNQDTYEVPRQWYIFAQEPLPPPVPELGPIEYPRSRLYRIPDRPRVIIFRSYPARAKSHQAQALADEGRFEDSQQAWQEAHAAWKRFGEENGIDPPPEKLREMHRLAQLFNDAYPERAGQGMPPPEYEKNNPVMQAGYEATKQLRWLNLNRQHTNYDHWEPLADTRKRPEATEAFRTLHEAARRGRADWPEAQRVYEDGFRRIGPLFGRPNTAFLLYLAAPISDLGSCFTYHATGGLVYYTRFGADTQNQEDLGEIQEQYKKVRARNMGCHLLSLTNSVWIHGLVCGHLSSAPGASHFAPLTAHLADIPLNLKNLEQVLEENLAGPVDLYIQKEVQEVIRGRQRRSPPSVPPGPTPMEPKPPVAGQVPPVPP